MGESTVQQFEQILAGLLPKLTPIGTRLVSQGLQAIQRRAQVIPSATDANKMGRVDKNGHPISYYERNKGTWYPVKKRSTLPVHPIKANKAIRLTKKMQSQLGIAGYKLIANSEQSRARWKIEVKAGADGSVTGELRNDASYSGEVFGWKSKEPKQADLMSSIGWQNMDNSVDSAMSAINQAISQAADEAVKLIVG